MTVDIETIDRIADVARLTIEPSKKEEAAKSLTDILDYVEVLTKIDTDGVKPTVSVTAGDCVLREDEVGLEFSQEVSLLNAPSAKKGHFAVPKVIS